MFEGELFPYIIVLLSLLLLISLYFNFHMSLAMKKQRESENMLIKSAYFNSVTELPNRVNIELVLGDQIDRALRHKKSFLVAVVKIMNYNDVKIRSQKLVDKFMLEASNRLLSSLRDEDIVGHITDDGFVIIFNEYLNEDNYIIIVERIKEAFIEAPYINTKYHIQYNIQIGHTKYPNDGTDATLLIDRAIHNALK